MADDLPREQLPANAVVFHVGEAGDAAFMIESGCVEVLGGDCGSRRLAVLSDGALFGEVALLDGLPRTATVRTLVPTTLVRIERAQVDEILKQTNPVIRHLLELLIDRFRNCRGFPDPYSAGGAEGASPVRDAALRTLVLTRDLSHAIDTDQLELFYQPIVRAVDHELLGFEALVRWRHPVLGMIMPLEFIGLAEKTGLVHRIGRWVLERAVSDWSRLRHFCRDGGPLPPFVSVNLSAAEFGEPGIVEFIRDCLAAHGMSPLELKVELTETVVIEDREMVAQVLERLAALGIAIALDDFGTGYAGLDYLKSLPISCLKIDKTFIQDMAHSLRSFEIVQSAVNLAWSLGITTVAEGIEDAETARRLREVGCELFQGYHFARPMPAGQVEAWVAAVKAEGVAL
ncbi:MAG: hypothetical protein H6R10_3247 [Rhodocyclaceae bacterium]|nr:hypothetical protein [Rhodocyclaceae bacterium]